MLMPTFFMTIVVYGSAPLYSGYGQQNIVNDVINVGWLILLTNGAEKSIGL